MHLNVSPEDIDQLILKWVREGLIDPDYTGPNGEPRFGLARSVGAALAVILHLAPRGCRPGYVREVFDTCDRMGGELLVTLTGMGFRWLVGLRDGRLDLSRNRPEGLEVIDVGRVVDLALVRFADQALARFVAAGRPDSTPFPQEAGAGVRQ